MPRCQGIVVALSVSESYDVCWEMIIIIDCKNVLVTRPDAPQQSQRHLTSPSATVPGDGGLTAAALQQEQDPLALDRARCPNHTNPNTAAAAATGVSSRRSQRHQPRRYPNHCLTYYVILSSLQIMLLFNAACQAIITDDLVVETTKGKIRGVTLKSATNR